MNPRRLDAAMEACRKKAKEFYIEGFRFHKNFGGIKGNRVVEGYSENHNYAVYVEY